MTDDPETRESLLLRVRNPQDAEAWDEFARIYRPVVYRLARGRGMQDADAQDLAQRVLMSVAAALPRWQRTGPTARFSHWLRRVAKNEALKVLTRLPRDRGCGGTTAASMMNEQPQGVHELETTIDLEFRRQLLRRASVIVRERADKVTWLVFSLTMIDGLSIAEASQKLGRNEGMVYAARSRIVRRLRDVARQLEDTFNDQ
ncbi:sigma-70 family RNA polymerase sigma factor [Novipirellula rosea]|uniref:Sigma-70 family RNA polymerase sigma factor n=1 Tax=Novipirellula rosea TaxID=1031540 RepID=A0ABP8MR34_9BACT